MIMIEYRVELARVREFMRAMRRVGRIRRRDGALSWGGVG